MASALVAPRRQESVDELPPRPELSVVGGLRERTHPVPGAEGRARRRANRKKVTHSRPLRVTTAAVLIACVVFGLVLLHIHVAQTSFQISDLQRHVAQMHSDNQRLRYEVARAESPEQIVEMSRVLGLVPPSDHLRLQGAVVPAGHPTDQSVPAGGSTSR